MKIIISSSWIIMKMSFLYTNMNCIYYKSKFKSKDLTKTQKIYNSETRWNIYLKLHLPNVSKQLLLTQFRFDWSSFIICKAVGYYNTAIYWSNVNFLLKKCVLICISHCGYLFISCITYQFLKCKPAIYGIFANTNQANSENKVKSRSVVNNCKIIFRSTSQIKKQSSR